MNTEISRQPPPASPKLQSGKALTDAFHPNQKEKIESFEWQYWSLLNSLSQCLQLNPNELRSLISHESKFDPGAINKGWSGWLMQLTKSPINDLAARPERYSSLYKSLEWIDFSWCELPKELQTLLQEMQKEKPNKAIIENLVTPLSKKRTDPLVNMVICSIYLAWLKNEYTKKESSLQVAQKKLSTLLNSPEDFKNVVSKMQASIPSIQPNEARKIFTEALNNPEDLRTFMSLKRYNGNPHKEWTRGLIHSDIYAALLLANSKLVWEKQTINRQQRIADNRAEDLAKKEQSGAEPTLPSWLFA